MNVLYVSDSDTLSGAEVVLLQHVEHFGPPAHRAIVLLPSSNHRLRAALEARGVPAVSSPAFSRRIIETTLNPFALAHFARSFARVSRELAALIEQHDIALVHSVSYPASLYAALACRRTHVPQVWHEHNIKRAHVVNRRIYRFVGSTCRWILGPSDAVTQNLAAFGLPAARLRTLYNGIDLRRFDPGVVRSPEVRQSLGIEPGTPAIALFGQMLPYKGHRTLIEALPAVRQVVPRARAFFVGALENPPYQRDLDALIASLGLRDIVSFTGWRQDVHAVMAAMDAVVVATTTPEPAALALMEAMAVGRPVIATRTGGTPEIVRDGETGLLFDPGDADMLANHLCRVLGDRTLAERLGRAGRARVEAHFSRERHLSALSDLYAQAVQGGG